MPKGPKSIGVLCAELGLDAEAETNLRKDALQYLQRELPDLVNASDAAIEPVSWQFLESGAGPRHFSWDAALNYQWEASEHRLTILQYMTEIMKMQRWYAIDRLHHRVKGGAANCTGCLLHSPKKTTPEITETGDGDDEDEAINIHFSDDDASDNRSIHHQDSKDTTPGALQSANGKKRPRPSHDDSTLPTSKKRKSYEPNSIDLDDAAVGSGQRASSSFNTTVPKSKSHSAFTAINATSHTEYGQKIDGQNSNQLLSLKDFNLSMRYRGKQWHFQSVAHKAKVLELLLLKEEKDVESYPVVAFSKGAKKAARDLDDDSESDDSMLKDYFRFYTHFMNERFPGNEKLLLENGVRPSA